jgi:hypothetical protein
MKVSGSANGVRYTRTAVQSQWGTPTQTVLDFVLRLRVVCRSRCKKKTCLRSMASQKHMAPVGPV